MSHNRRMFGGRPGIGGPGGGHQMSPWEGGVVPGQGRPGTAGILGAAPQPLNLLSQLSTPEAQLALASNLLTSLLGQQQQQPPMQQPRVPPGPQPLLSMNATAPGRGFFPRPDGMKHGGGPMRQQRNHGTRFPDSYKQRGGDGRPRPHAPVKRGGGVAGQPRTQRKSGGGTPNKGSPHVEKKLSDSTNTTKSNADESTNNEENDETEKNESTVQIKEEPREDEEDEEAEEGKKRDWKDEKNKKESVMDVEEEQGKEQPNSESPGKGAKPNKEGAKGAPDASRYATVPKDLLVCHICNKNMWDGQSFENHLRGKSHQMMMDQTEKSYKVQVKLMRQELKLAEEKREIEMERVQRLGKKVNIKSREYCTMCDLYFFGNIMGHRKNQLHQNLKNFLHPRCTFCSQEFPSRTEWDHHQLTPMHLQKLAEIRKSDGKDSAGEVAVMVEDKPALPDGEDGKQAEGADAPSGESGATEGESSGTGAPAAGSGGTEPTEGKTAAAGTPGTANATSTAGVKRPSGRQTVPPYDPKKSYGVNLLKKVLGYTCDVCNRFFFQHKEALAHCQTAPHYKSYVAHLYRTGAAAPPGSPTRAKQGSAPAAAAAAGAAAAAAAATASDKSGGDKSQEKNTEEIPESKRSRKESDASVEGRGPVSDSAAEQTPQEQGADSTTESEVKDGDGQADVDDTESGAAEPATNGPDGPSENQADDPDDGAEDEDDAKSDSAGTDKSVTAADESINMEEADAPASQNKVDEKKLSPSPANRRGMGRGMGRGRGRGHRRR